MSEKKIVKKFSKTLHVTLRKRDGYKEGEKVTVIKEKEE